MNDTSDKVREHYRTLLMRRSGVERLRMGSDMFDAARALVRASLVDSRVGGHPPDLEARFFERIYGRDFDPETVARIVSRLRAAAARRGEG